MGVYHKSVLRGWQLGLCTPRETNEVEAICKRITTTRKVVEQIKVRSSTRAWKCLWRRYISVDQVLNGSFECIHACRHGVH